MSSDSFGNAHPLAIKRTAYSSPIPTPPRLAPLIAPEIPTIDWTGNRLSAARDLGALTGNQVFNEFVGESDPVDIYRFRLDTSKQIRFNLSNLSADADLFLIQDANGDGNVDLQEQLRTSDSSGNTPESIDIHSLGQGEYFLQVASYNGDTSYQLILDTAASEAGEQLGTSEVLGIITGQTMVRGTVDALDRTDIYQFQVHEPTDLQIDLTNLVDDLDMYLIQDQDEDGEVDRKELISRSFYSGTQDELINRTQLAAGTYFLEVRRYTGNSNYDLTFTSDRAGATLDTAKYLGNLDDNEISLREFVGASDTDDIYEFYLNTAGNVQIALSDLSESANTTLFQDINKNGLVEAAEIIQESFDTIELLPLESGQYFIQFSGTENSNYQLRIASTPTETYQVLTGTLSADRFIVEANTNTTIISGIGNIDFGKGQYDVLDLSTLESSQLRSLNLVDAANSIGQRVDVGGGVRLFDSLALDNGQQVWFEGLDQIEFADRTIDLSITPNDPFFNQQWNLHMMGVHNAWRFGTGNQSIAIGIEDSGVAFTPDNQTHFDIRQDATFSVSPNNIADEFSTRSPDSHGTSLQTIIGAATNNAQGIAGINWNADIFMADVLVSDPNDLDLGDATEKIIQAAFDRGQKLIINLSLGQNFLEPGFERLVEANQDNVLFVVASGNENNDTLAYPAVLAQRYPNVIAVGAVWGRETAYEQLQEPGTRVVYPGRWGSNYGDGLSLMGPAEVPAGRAKKHQNGDIEFSIYEQFSGTSAATPHIAGVASLIWSAHPQLNANDIRQILEETAFDLGNPGYDEFYGHGFVNADAAVRRALVLR